MGGAASRRAPPAALMACERRAMDTREGAAAVGEARPQWQDGCQCAVRPVAPNRLFGGGGLRLVNDTHTSTAHLPRIA